MSLSSVVRASAEADVEVSVWDLPIVSEGEATKLASEPDASTLLPTAEDIENIQRQAHKEAYDSAYKDAFEAAKKKGFEEGKVSGHEEGLKLGAAEGFAQALAEGAAVIEEKSAHFSGLISCLAVPLEKLDNEVENELVTLAMLVARHLIRRELKHDPSQVIAVIRQAVKILPISTQDITLFLHPEDLILVRESLSLGEHDELRWKAIEDPMLSRGGCKIETVYSRIDASVESQINNVIAQVLGGERGSDHVNASVSP